MDLSKFIQEIQKHADDVSENEDLKIKKPTTAKSLFGALVSEIGKIIDEHNKVDDGKSKEQFEFID